MTAVPDENRSLLEALIGDGRPLLRLTGLLLILSGLFAFFLSATRHFLPHDVAHLGMTSEELCTINECRIVHFMIHDRVSFGGTLVGIGILYLWLVEFPLSLGQPWAWWLFVVSGVVGFGSFLLYLGYGYLDTWHGMATLALLPCFIWGLIRTHGIIARPTPPHPSPVPRGTPPGEEGGVRGLVPFSSLARGSEPIRWDSVYGVGRLLLLVTALCLAIGGLIISSVGTTTVFVPQDLEFMGLSADQLRAINPRLVPLIAHDRAGFGGGICCCGVTMFFCIWCGQASRSLWQALLLTGLAGFGTGIGVHPAVGYLSFSHLAPALLGAGLFTAGMAMTFNRMWFGLPTAAMQPD